MYIMNTTQTIIAVFILCLLIALAIVFRVFFLPKLPTKVVKKLQAFAVCCVVVVFLITEYTVLGKK